jgi:hypothetical protein
MAYAKGTKTEIGTTETQIKKMLQKAGAEAIAFMEERSRAIIAFHLNGRAIRFNLPLPQRDQFTHSNYGARGMQPNKPSTIDNLWMQANRERWRQLHLCIKAKLESVEQNIELFDDAFLSQIVMPDGETIGEKVKPQMTALMEGKPLRPLMLEGPAQ